MSDAGMISDRYHRWFDAIMTGDAGPLSALLADDFTYVDIYGQVFDRSRYLRLLGRIPAIVMQLGDVETRSYGDVVLAVGDYTVDGHLDTGKVLRSHARFSALWRYDGTAWRCHAHHSTSITSP